MKSINEYLEDQLYQDLCYIDTEIDESGGLYEGQLELSTKITVIQKEYLARGFKKVLYAYTKKEVADKIIEIATTIKVIVIQEIEASDSEKFLITLLNESLIFLLIILNTFITICSFRKIF